MTSAYEKAVTIFTDRWMVGRRGREQHLSWSEMLNHRNHSVQEGALVLEIRMAEAQYVESQRNP